MLLRARGRGGQDGIETSEDQRQYQYRRSSKYWRLRHFVVERNMRRRLPRSSKNPRYNSADIRYFRCFSLLTYRLCVNANRTGSTSGSPYRNRRACRGSTLGMQHHKVQPPLNPSCPAVILWYVLFGEHISWAEPKRVKIITGRL